MDEVFDEILRGIETLEKSLSEGILQGRPVDMPAYKHLVGQVLGLRQAADVVKKARQTYAGYETDDGEDF